MIALAIPLAEIVWCFGDAGLARADHRRQGADYGALVRRRQRGAGDVEIVAALRFKRQWRRRPVA